MMISFKKLMNYNVVGEMTLIAGIVMDSFHCLISPLTNIMGSTVMKKYAR